MQLATAGRATRNALEVRACERSIPRGRTPKQPDTALLMARKRMLSPEMFTSRSVNALPVATRWTWAGLLCYLDDYGYGEDEPALVKADVWPRDDSYTTQQVAGDLDQLTEAGNLCRFVCCDKPQIHAPKWTDYQKVQHPSLQPRFCVCPQHSRNSHETHLRVSRARHESLALIEVNSSQRSSSDSVHDLSDCLRPDLCHFHRTSVTA
jgi:hypothetical protein